MILTINFKQIIIKIINLIYYKIKINNSKIMILSY